MDQQQYKSLMIRLALQGRVVGHYENTQLECPGLGEPAGSSETQESPDRYSFLDFVSH